MDSEDTNSNGQATVSPAGSTVSLLVQIQFVGPFFWGGGGVAISPSPPSPPPPPSGEAGAERGLRGGAGQHGAKSHRQ